MKYNTIFFFIGITLLHLACKAPKQLETKSEIVSVLDYGADPSGKLDASLAFQNAINSNAPKVVVPAGRYRIDKTVEVKSFLFLEAGVHIYQGESAKEGPIFWLNKSNAILAGEHKGVVVESRKSSPFGIIRIGHGQSNSKGGNILYCTVKNLTLKGNKGEGSIGIKLNNNQKKGNPSMASYFHNIQNLIIEYVDVGIHLLRMSNANSISQIYFNRVGDSIHDAAIFIEGAMENRIYDCFHHLSPNAATIRMKNYGDLSPVYNYIYGIVSEQGGDQALCLDFYNGKHNIIEINCNTLKGSRLRENFEGQKNALKRK
ncbi:MAG: hypothetical protein HKN09_13425 [Saprospiraceae bacterium]|nr:hypothetical protein [Saprospiraceae bacterium]